MPAHEDLREPENGLVMVRGRIGGDGAPFNLGEATVSRAAVRLATGEVGFGYTLGRDRQKARMIALCDALVQSDEFAGAMEAKVLAPLARGHHCRAGPEGAGDRGDAGRFLHDGARGGLSDDDSCRTARGIRRQGVCRRNRPSAR